MKLSIRWQDVMRQNTLKNINTQQNTIIKLGHCFFSGYVQNEVLENFNYMENMMDCYVKEHDISFYKLLERQQNRFHRFDQ